ncbi:MAG: protein-L-isoaspartate(D-aspartate) O-methyltransferase [Woeseia sp.]
MTSARTRERLVQRLLEQGITSQEVLSQIRNVPRHLFVDEALASRAYEDTALPIGLGQTISQPYVVARMTEALLANLKGERRVLEIGTGCGYQTAVLAPLVKEIHTVERIPELLRKTRRRLADLNIYNISFRQGDGWLGWPKYAPYDGILVAAAASSVPVKLLEQLAPEGCLILPVGPPGRQDLSLVTRTAEGFEQRSLGAVSFVPLVQG